MWEPLLFILFFVFFFQYQILLTRYEGGSKGPVVLIHGGALSSEMFALDTIETNLLEYIFKEGYVYSFHFSRTNIG